MATNDVCFLDEDNFEAHETRVCIYQGRTLDDPRRERRYSPQQYLKSAEEMAVLFADLPEALENSVEIARRCNVHIDLGTYHLPNYPVPQGVSLEAFLDRCATEGLAERLAGLEADGALAASRDEYAQRLSYELSVINQMGFPGYFLIVMEFIAWAKDHRIPVGPGRGSGAGSLVAYSLGITDLDPLHYDLLFERFLNPERVSMPDFDVDFCMEGRDRVINHVSERYGTEAVSQIVTFGTMAARAVVKDVARAQGKPYGLADRLSKLIPFEVGMTLAKAVAQSSELAEFIASNDEVSEIMDMAYPLEGVVRGIGRHAGGVVIAPAALTEFVPLYVDDQSGGLVSQFDKDDVESAGLVKFDFLGLKTLTIIDWTVKAVNARDPEDTLLINRLPLDDPATYELLKHARTTGIFQLESRGMRDLIQRLGPDNINDIIALVALYRPGPLQSGAVDEYIDRKHGREPVVLPHPSTGAALEDTFGVMLYQEQVMRIAQDMAGFTLGQADLLRRAMGKKKLEEMAKVREQFLEGSIAHGVQRRICEDIFDDMEKFSGYAFNKSHSATYALVSFQTAWLKCHHPAEFMAATLSADMRNIDRAVKLVAVWMENRTIVRVLGAGRALLAGSMPGNRLAHAGVQVSFMGGMVPMPNSRRGGGIIACSASGKTEAVLQAMHIGKEYAREAEQTIKILGIASHEATQFEELCDVFVGIHVPKSEYPNPLSALADTEEYVISELLDGIVVKAGQEIGFDDDGWRRGHEDIGATGPYAPQ